MSLPFRSFFVGKRIRDICDIQSYPSEVDEKVTPVLIVNPSEHPGIVGITDRGTLTKYVATVSVSSTGAKTADIYVPTGKKAIIKAIETYKSGTWTVDACAQYVSIDSTAANGVGITEFYTSTENKYILPNNIIVPGGNLIRSRINVATYTSSGTFTTIFLVQEITESQWVGMI